MRHAMSRPKQHLYLHSPTDENTSHLGVYSRYNYTKINIPISQFNLEYVPLRILNWCAYVTFWPTYNEVISRP